MPTLVSLPQAPLPSAPPNHLPFRSTGPPLLGCCETPAVSLAEAQQELQMLQKQLGESEHFRCICVPASGSSTPALLRPRVAPPPRPSAWLWFDGRVFKKLRGPHY